MALLEIAITPVGTDSTSFSSFVAEACQVAEQQGVRFQVTPTGTVLEGELPRVLAVAEAMHEAAFRGKAGRVVTNIHIDDRRDQPQTMEHAVQAVRQ